MSYGKRISWLQNQKQKRAQRTIRSNRIVLFDMDGTLTPPRQAFDKTLIEPLRHLSQFAQIGIVTGSDLDYVNQQLEYVLKRSELVYCMHILPCNGTKWYPPPHQLDDWYNIKHEADMKETLGNDAYRKLMLILLEQQLHFAELDIPLSGQFIQYRGSMINWCPIGRSAGTEDRKRFVQYDEKTDQRLHYLNKVRGRLSLHGLDKYITCALGGDTSFDIYPKGWDKTYALKHFEGKDVWFVGDRCDDNGNDKQIYDALEPLGRSYKTDGINKTKEIIETITERLRTIGITNG